MRHHSVRKLACRNSNCQGLPALAGQYLLLEPVDRLADFKLPGNLGYSSDVPAIFINPYKNVDKKCDMEILKNLLSIQ